MTGQGNWRSGTTSLKFFLVVLIGLLVVFAFVPKRKPVEKSKVTILDPRMNVLWAKMIKGTNVYYLPAGGDVLGGQGLGSRFEGKFRAQARSWGVPVDALPAFTAGKGPDGRAFLISYAFPVPPTSSVHMDAELVAGDGALFPLRSIAGGGGGPPERSWDLWILDSLPSAGTNYFLRLRLQTSGTPAAEIRFAEP